MRRCRSERIDGRMFGREYEKKKGEREEEGDEIQDEGKGKK